MPEKKQLKQLRAGIARATRASRRSGDARAADELRRDYAAAKLEDYVRRTVNAAPPLTQDQQSRIAALLWSGGEAA